ncbi:hypothetical protein SCYAM73S_05021 [Streptomyces cyaneofuscatus]
MYWKSCVATRPTWTAQPGADEPVEGLGQPGGGEVDTEFAAFLAAAEEGGDPGVGPVPALVDLIALEELVLRDEEREQAGAGLDGRDEAAQPLLGGAFVEPGGVQGRLERLDTEILQRLHQRVASGEVAVEGGAADPGCLATSSMVAVDLWISRAAALRSTCSRSRVMRRA